MKLTAVVNLTNILRAAFMLIFFCQKLQSQTVIRGNVHKTLLYKKAACKMLMKVIPGGNPYKFDPKKD